MPGVVKDLYAKYPDPADFRDSTAAARLNGYIGGHGDADTLAKQIDSLGLTETGKTTLHQITDAGLAPVCPVVN
jgi:peptide-methionine (S)-S-oxide reductase